MIDDENDMNTVPGDTDPADADPGEAAQEDADLNAADTDRDDFVRWDESKLKQVPISNLGYRTIVKKRFVENEAPIKITPAIPKSRLHSQADADITPILQDEQIVGVQVACHCGSVHEIMFDYLPS